MQPTSVIINQDSFRAFDDKGLKHPVEPIKQLVPLVFTNVSFIRKEIRLADFLNCDLLIKFVEVPYFADGGEDGDEVTLNFGTIHPRGHEIDAFRVSISKTPQETNIVLDYRNTYLINSNVATEKIILYCLPIYFLEQINIDLTVPQRG